MPKANGEKRTNKTQSQQKKRKSEEKKKMKQRLRMENINETKNLLFEKTKKLINLQPGSSRKKRGEGPNQ